MRLSCFPVAPRVPSRQPRAVPSRSRHRQLPLALPVASDEGTAPGDAERRARRLGHECIVGVDEVGRGALAGPVVAAAAWVPADAAEALLREGLRDSKRLSPRHRERLAERVRREALVALGAVDAPDIDASDIRTATFEAMRRALHALRALMPSPPDLVLVDGREPITPFPWGDIPQHPLVGGDDRSVNIAAAAVVAKVHRDALLVEMSRSHPGYGFERHKGYGTALHLRALARFGPCPLHRRSFAPVRRLLSPSMAPSPRLGTNEDAVT